MDKVLHAPCACATFRFGKVPLAVLSDQRLTHADRTIYGIVAAHRNHRSGLAWPARNTIAGLAGMHVNSVSRSTRRLIEAGHLTVERDGRGRGRSTRYQLPLADASSSPQPACEKGNPGVSEPPATPLRGEQKNTTPTADSPPPAPPPGEPRGEELLDLNDLPPNLSPLIPALLLVLKGAGRQNGQMLLDELAGRVETAPPNRKITRPCGYLRWLREALEAKTLVFEHAERIAARRRKRRIIAFNLERAKAPPGSPPGAPQARKSTALSTEEIHARFAAMRAALR